MRQKDVIKTHTLQDILGWLAFDMTQREEFKEKMEQERRENLTPEEEVRELMKIFGPIEAIVGSREDE